jgi:hypothetical protein
MWRRSIDFRKRAAMHGWAAEMFRGRLRNAAAFYPSAQDEAWALRRAAYHERLGQNYRRAARHPWLPVEPDPPEPE